MQNVDLAIIIVKRDSEGLSNSRLSELQLKLSELDAAYEIIIAAACSVTVQGGDNSGIVQNGYGSTLLMAFAKTRAKYVITLDSNLSNPFEVIRDFWANRQSAEIIIASRYISGAKSSVPRFRQICSRFLNDLCGSVLSLTTKDLSSGIRMYSRRVLDTCRFRSKGYEILLESLIKAISAGFKVAEIPIHYSHTGTSFKYDHFPKFVMTYLFELNRMWALRNSVDSADYDDRAYRSRIPLQRYWQRKRYKIITSYLGNTDGLILDVGCGSSKIIQSLPNAVAVDIAAHKLRFIRATNPHCLQASTFKLPFADQTFDCMIHSEVLEHIRGGLEVFFEMNRVLKPGAVLIVGTPDYGRIWWPIFEFFYNLILPNAYAQEHITHYTLESLLQCLRESGFEEVEHAYILGGELIVKATKKNNFIVNL